MCSARIACIRQRTLTFLVLQAGFNVIHLFVAWNLSPFVVFNQHVLSLPRCLNGHTDSGCLLSNAKKRRGLARASLTRLSTHLRDLEGSTKTLELAITCSRNSPTWTLSFVPTITLSLTWWNSRKTARNIACTWWPHIGTHQAGHRYFVALLEWILP